MQLIEARGLKKCFGRKEVLRGLTFSLREGEVVGLAGINGAGKSTTIDLLMGFLENTGGKLRVLGEDPATRRHLDQVGWMPESPGFPGDMRVRRLLAFQASTFPSWDAGFAADLGARLGLDLGARFGKLSRGQKGKVALLLALAHRPRLLLLDDPTLGLDPGSRRLLLGELLATAAEEGTGVLLSTQMLAEVGRSLDRLVVLHQGKLWFDRTMDEIAIHCRRLHLPPGSPPPPLDLEPVSGGEGFFSTRWDEEAWRHYRDDNPGAQAEPAELESLFISLTGGAP